MEEVEGMDATEEICIATPSYTQTSPAHSKEDRNDNNPQTKSIEREDTLSYSNNIKVVEKSKESSLMKAINQFDPKIIKEIPNLKLFGKRRKT